MTDRNFSLPPDEAGRGLMRKKGGRRSEEVLRSRWTQVHSTREIGALVRILRLRAGLTQVEAAEKLGVGRRWYNDLENGKETIRAGMMLEVFEKLGCVFGIGGDGAGFTLEELTHVAVIKGKEDQIWYGEFDRAKAPDCAAAESVISRGHKKGHIKLSEQIAQNHIEMVKARKG